MPGRTEESKEIPHQESRCLGWNLEKATPKHATSIKVWATRLRGWYL